MFITNVYYFVIFSDTLRMPSTITDHSWRLILSGVYIIRPHAVLLASCQVPFIANYTKYST